jgi:type I restriction enzyme R subunit
MKHDVTETSINEFGWFDQLKASVDFITAKAYFEKVEGSPIRPFRVPAKVDATLRKFVLEGGFDIE